MLESSGRLCGAGVKLGGGFNLNLSVVWLEEKMRISALVTSCAGFCPTTALLSCVVVSGLV